MRFFVDWIKVRAGASLVTAYFMSAFRDGEAPFIRPQLPPNTVNGERASESIDY